MEPVIDKGVLIERYRYAHVEYETQWTVNCTEALTERLTALGCYGIQEYWDVSYCQDSGASFKCGVDPNMFFAAKAGNDFPLLSKAVGLGFEFDSAKVQQGGRYVHSNMMYVNWDYPPYIDDVLALITGDELTAAVAYVDNWYDKIEQETIALEELMEQTFRDMADEFYEELKNEHEHLTSDEVVWEWIESSGIAQGESDDDCDD